ncbi:MAG TPA: hypothetical protein G4O17_01745 [Dehalococcoidia bacterium]|jgi:hypothetical protein|nr:hypothetical protein [Dehalococcoidia bacterium]
MLESKQYHLTKRMRWAGRVIGLLAAGFLLTMLIGTAIAEVLTEGWEPITTDIEGVLLGVLGIIALAGCIASWWRDRLAGILLILTAAGLGIHIGLCAGRNHFLAWLMMGFPYLAAGVLLLTAWRLSRKTA